jgi:hypothetical protein
MAVAGRIAANDNEQAAAVAGGQSLAATLTVQRAAAVQAYQCKLDKLFFARHKYRLKPL